MRKLIERANKGPNLNCDNPQCDFTIELSNLTTEELKDFINTECPYCKQNLLTKEDYETYHRFIKIVEWINKWFSWITIFYSRKAKYKTVQVDCHDGVKIKDQS